MAFYVSDTKLKVFERKYFKILVLKFKIKPKAVGVSRAEFLYNSNSSRSITPYNSISKECHAL